ncbi:AcrB/AcrD/AcrF family protein [Desulfonema ishimotonii]|uniref:AcrB/AcrD/AcrF family protein n=1 Tax=Desulfonema ishimotonii TaxID=45657 RepID=A0A401G343_9BACT|nr:efflux RND transporter permease subunit [Desulfonema ishimotonii]GBC63636.1 AcrB/AcrD/AcrF family protein [Desulfonema ishimotonii]
MNLPAFAIKNRAVTYFAAFLLVFAGIAAFFSLGQLEDPEFTIKTASITTLYPGASPEEVELEVTDRIEVAVQEMAEVDYIESISRAGVSIIKVNIKPSYWADRLPQVWDQLRRKIRDTEGSLPPGCQRPDIGDDFGDVFGFQLALTGDGFNYAEMEAYAKELRKELLLVDGVARIDFWGVQSKVIYLDVSQTQLTELGLTDQNIFATLEQQNVVVDAGSLDLQSRRFRIAPSGEFRSAEDIGNLTIRPTLIDTLQDEGSGKGLRASSELIRIRDIGTVRRAYREPPTALMRYDGQPAIGISITNASGVNIVDVGRAIDHCLEDLVANLPVGIEVRRIHWQSDVVAEAVNGFVINFAEAVAIVLIVLTLFMGWRMGLIIGMALVLTILGSFILMALFGIDLQRMSLGALVIALGMMVDNAIVVADGISVRIRRGMDRTEAAIEAASQPAMPLLGATVVAVMAFYPIFGSPEDVGEYCRSLFTVVGISLLFSWLISMTVTPLQCIDLLPEPEKDGAETDEFGGKFYQKFRNVLSQAIRMRVLTMGCMVGLLLIAMIGFGNVRQLFFPDSSMTKFMIDFWAPEGTRIQQVAADLRRAEKKLMADKRVESLATFIGMGPPRFYLPVEPEMPYSSYAQFIVNMHDYREINGLIAELEPWFAENYPQAQIPFRKYGVGPSNTYKFELRISGPAVADADVLRELAGKTGAILDASPLADAVSTDWRQRVQKVVPVYNQERARWASVTREDIANATKRAFDGRTVGLYREEDDLIPIVLRHVEEERLNVGNLDLLQVQPSLSTRALPLSQVTDKVRMTWEDPIIWRRDRRRTITVQSNPVAGVTFPSLRAGILDDISALELPPGYTTEWGGEFESSQDAQKSLIPGVIPAGVIMSFIIVALFNAFKPPLIIAFTIPFAAIGIVAGLLGTGTPFGFMALLGAMSLVGMMIKNAIVLLDEVNLNLAAGKSDYVAITDAAVSRLRPVALAAATTVLGVLPLLQDVFWVGMAVTIMAGLTFGTVLTMVVVPVLYCILFRVKSPEKG